MIRYEFCTLQICKWHTAQSDELRCGEAPLGASRTQWRPGCRQVTVRKWKGHQPGPGGLACSVARAGPGGPTRAGQGPGPQLGRLIGVYLNPASKDDGSTDSEPQTESEISLMTLRLTRKSPAEGAALRLRESSPGPRQKG